MSCTHVRHDLSAYLDGDLSQARCDAVSAHLHSCGACARHFGELRQSIEALATLPRLSSPESLASGVMDRLEIERRGPGLALLFRSASAARPLMVPSLLPAALVLICTWSVVLMVFAHDYRSSTQAPVAGAPSTDAAASATDIFFDEQLVGLGEQDIFVETFVNKDGRVSYVKLLEGDSKTAYPIMHELAQQRRAPGHDRNGRPVETQAFQLISSIEVRAPRT